jgi:nicotinamide riboside kinase
MIKIAITGPESCGKTTLCRQLSKETNSMWIPEFARTYLNKQGGVYQRSDLDAIALVQFALWEKLAKGKLVFFDTDMTVMKVWSDFKFGASSRVIIEQYEAQTFDHYFLCAPDIPWEEDHLREHPHQREELFKLYAIELQKMGRPFTIVNGNELERLSVCKQILHSILA